MFCCEIFSRIAQNHVELSIIIRLQLPIFCSFDLSALNDLIKMCGESHHAPLLSAAPFSSLKSHSLDSGLTDLELTEIAGCLDPNDYIFLGIKLGFDKARLNQFKHNNPGDIAGAMATMLIRWRNDQSAPPRVVRKTFSDALKYVERSDLAGTIYDGGISLNKIKIT